MNAVLLDGSQAGDLTSASLLEALLGELKARGIALQDHWKLREQPIACCLGDFDCWLKTPGICRTNDVARDVTRSLHDVDLMIGFGRSSFGGWPSDLKKALDRSIGLALPFFEQRGGETHHPMRYPRMPAILGVAWHPQAAARERTFMRLVRRNALNLDAPRWAAALLGPVASRWPDAIRATLHALETGSAPVGEDPDEAHADLLAEAHANDFVWAAPRRVTLLVGSARPPGTSTSETLGRALLELLEKRGAATRLIHATQFIHDDAADEAALELRASDLLILSTPLYVDSLPYLVTRALERIARSPIGAPRFAMLVNCGFPEAEQCVTALAIGRNFASEAGLLWAGGLALGAGETIHGRTLKEAGSLVHNVRTALELAADRLAIGRPIPDRAIEKMAMPLFPRWVYQLAARHSTHVSAKHNGLSRHDLFARPYETGPAQELQRAR